MKKLRHLSVSRPYVSIQYVTSHILIGLSDASVAAFGSVIYIQTKCLSGSSAIQLVCSKTRILPAKPISIHRLELSAALLLANLLDSVHQNLKLPVTEVYAYSDSLVTLFWLAKDPSTWGIYLKNCVQAAHQLIPPSQWAYIHTTENPADMLSRGIKAQKLIESSPVIFIQAVV